MAIAYTASLLYSGIYAVVAYVIPGYQSFKAIEKRGTDDEKYWIVYWVVLSALYCTQWLIDFVLCWLPFYYVAKLGAIVALWHPSTRLALTIYTRVFGPVLSSYEADIDKLLVESKTRGMDLMGQHAGSLRTALAKAGAQGSAAVGTLRQKIVERTKAAKAPAADATHGLHSE